MNENQMNEITQQVDGGITPTEVEYDEFAGTSVQGTEPMATLDGGQEELIEIPIEEVAQALGVEMIETEPMTDATEGGPEINHALLHNREAENQHPIGAITGLSDRLKSIESVKRVYGKGSSYAEFRKWQDSNPNGADRSGYFVYMAPNSDTIEICDESHEVYGVTTSDAAFVGNQVDSDRSDDWAYSMVSLIGAVKVRTDGTARVGEHVVPNNYGEATLAENNYGYKVLSLGSYAEYNYAVIALVPQSSALNKILGSLSGGDLDIGGLLIEIDGLKGSISDALDKSQIAIDTSNMSKEDIEDILGELDIQKSWMANTDTILSETQAQAEHAATTAQQAQSSAVAAAQAAQSAKEEAVASANQALTETASLRENMTPLVEWDDPNSDAYGIAGFVAQANSDHTLLASIVAGGDDSGSDLTAIKQTKDMIQHLVSHMDRYSVGDKSLSYGLSTEEAVDILTDTYIYVSTSDHDEQMGDITFTFQRGYAYTWNTDTCRWDESGEISTATEYKVGTEVGDLWYCWQPGITQTDENGEIVTTYNAGTLYRWYGSEWVAIATVNDDYRRATSVITQTADSLRSDIVALDGSVSTMQQTVDGFATRVGNAEGNISSIEQEINQIKQTISTPDGTLSSLQQQVNDNTAAINLMNTGRFHMAYQSFLEVAPEAEGDKYTQPPMWDDVAEEFVFNDTYIDNTNGAYYFIDEDHTKYCHVTGDASYDIYTIGNKVTSLIHSRIDENESRIDLLAEFENKTNESIAGLTAKADANEAEISSVAARFNHILLSVSTEEVPMYGIYMYIKAPEWNSSTNQYEFNIADRITEGVGDSADSFYYMADDKNQTYCRVVTASDDTVLYETYGLADSSVAALQQKVDENGAAIGLVVDENGVKGSAIIEAINGESTAIIDADKINLDGFVTFTDLTSDATTISGPNINCYNGQFSLRSGTAGNYTEVITLDSDGSLVVNNKNNSVVINDEGLICYNEGFSLRLGTPENYTEALSIDSMWGLTLKGAIYQSTNYGHFILWNGQATWVTTTNEVSRTVGSLSYDQSTASLLLSAGNLLDITSSNTLTLRSTNTMTLSASALNLPNVVRCYTDGMWSLTALTADGSNLSILSLSGSNVNLTATQNIDLTGSGNTSKVTLSSANQIQLTARYTCSINCEYFEVTSNQSCVITCNGVMGFRSSTASSTLMAQYIAEGYSNGAYMIGTGSSLIFNTPNLFFIVGGTQYWLYFQNGYVRYNT